MSIQASDPSGAAVIRSAKRSLRTALLAARRGSATRPDLADHLLAVPELQTASIVAGYVPLRGEPNVAPALDLLRERGVQVLLPRLLEDRDLAFANGATHVDIEQADVVIVPALAADRRGYRLGRGKGSYDRVLHRIRPDALTLAVIHPEELLPEVPIEPHDLRVGAVLAGVELIRV